MTKLITGWGYWTFANMPIRVLWTIRGKTYRGQAGLFADKVFEATAEPLDSL